MNRSQRSLLVVALLASLGMAGAPALGKAPDRAAAGDKAAAASDKPAAPAESGKPRVEAEGSMTVADLEKMLAPLTQSDDLEARRGAAKAVADLGPDAVTAITKELAELRKTQSAGVFAIMKSVREAHGGKLPEGGDLLEELFKLKKGDAPGYKTAVWTVALLRGLAHIGTTPAARQLVAVAQDHQAQLRPEVGRLVKQLGERAVPALIEARKAETSDQRHWAALQLEGLGKRLPGDAVQTKNNQILSDVLRAYGTIHDMDALPVILSFVNSDRAQVRKEAREAVAAFGQDAIWKLREAYSNLTGKTAPDGWSAEQVRTELWAAFDRFRLDEVYKLLEQGRALEQNGKLEEATSAYDRVLARQPMLDRRGEMVSGYVAYAQSLEDKEPEKALALFRKAERLDPEGPRKAQIQAEIAYLEGMSLVARGVAEAEPFRRALELDPGHAKARVELDRLENAKEERKGRTQRFVAAGVVLAVAIAGILLFGGRKRPSLRARRGASA
jgi:hypothetical protein